MDAVTITASGEPFRVSRSLLKKHSRYFELRFGDAGSSEKAVDFPGIPADAFAALVSYFSKPEMNITDKSPQLLSAVQEAACTLGVMAFPLDLEKSLKTSWSNLADLSTVFNVASRLGIHSAMVHTIVDDVLSLFLGSKDVGGLRESSLTYEILIYITRLAVFWEKLFDRCKYFFTYESFFQSVVEWIVKHDANEANVVSLLDSLKLQTVSFKFLNDCVANSTGLPDMKEELKFVLQRKQEMVVSEVGDHLHQLRISWYNAKQGDVLLFAYNAEKFIWDETLKFTRSPLDTSYTATSENYVYALGDQTVTSARIQGGAPIKEKYPERLEINYCFAHSSSLFCFAWNKRDLVLYEFHSERRKFLNHGTVPVDSNIVATAFEKNLFVLGEVLHTSAKSNQLKVFRYDLKSEMFTWVAILKKTWCQPELTDELDVHEVPSSCKSHLVIVGDTMYAFVQEFSSSIKSELYYFVFKHDSNNSYEIEPTKLDLPLLMDRHAALVGLHNSPRGIAMIFRSSFKREYALALLDQAKGTVKQIGYLPHFPNAPNVSAEYLCLLQTMRNPDETVPKMGAEEQDNLLRNGTGSEDTLVRDENDLSLLNTSTGVPESLQYRSPRRKDLADHRTYRDSQFSNPSDVADGFQRPLSRRSSLASGFSFSSKASRKSKKSSKKSIASRAASVMASFVR